MKPKRILAVKLRELGDTVLWEPALRALHDKFPAAELDILVLKGAKPLLLHHPSVKEVHTASDRSFWSLVRLFWRLREKRYNLVLGFHATTNLSRALPLLGAKQKLVHHYNRKKNSSSDVAKLENPAELTDAISRDFKIIRALGVSEPQSVPRLFLSAQEKVAAVEALNKAGVNSAKKIVVLLPGARVETHRYPKDLWLKLVDGLISDSSLRCIVLSDPALSQQWDLLSLCRARNIPLWDNLSLRDFMGMLSRGDVAVGNDSGPVHIASALGLRTVTLFGPGCAGDYHPYDLVRHSYVRIGIECRNQGPENSLFSYCTLSKCSHLSCLRRLELPLIVSKIREVL